MDSKLAQRVRNLKQSDIRRFSILCNQVGGVNLGQGICDQPAPQPVKRGAIHAIEEDLAIYTHLRGIAELRAAVAQKLARFNKINVDPETEVTVTVGSAGAFACACMALLDPGDEVINFSPFYGYHTNMLRLLGVETRFVDLRPPDWRFSTDELSAAFSDKTRFVLVNTPSNPSGKIFTREELTAIARLCRERDVLIVTDEIYEYITFDRPHVSMASLPEAAGRTITISGGSKTYAITGYRVGYAAGPAAIIDKMAVLHDVLYICAPSISQHAMLGGLTLPDSYYEEMCRDYRVKRDMLAASLTRAGFTCFVPEGAYYMLVSFPAGRYRDDTDAAERLLSEVGVASIPGSAFYFHPADGANQLRFCFAKQTPALEEACRRIDRLA